MQKNIDGVQHEIMISEAMEGLFFQTLASDIINETRMSKVSGRFSYHDDISKGIIKRSIDRLAKKSPQLEIIQNFIFFIFDRQDEPNEKMSWMLLDDDSNKEFISSIIMDGLSDRGITVDKDIDSIAFSRVMRSIFRSYEDQIIQFLKV